MLNMLRLVWFLVYLAGVNAWLDAPASAIIEQSMKADFPLQIQTAVKQGGDDLIWIDFFVSKESKIGKLQLMFDSKMRYKLEPCFEGEQSFKKELSSEQLKIWTIIKQKSRIKLYSNGMKVLDYAFTENCTNWKDETFVGVSFGWNSEQSRPKYRTRPKFCEGIPNEWEGIVADQNVEFPADSGTNFGVSCEKSGFKNGGSRTVTCDTNENDDFAYSVRPGCILGM